jgi:hypothetical protein
VFYGSGQSNLCRYDHLRMHVIPPNDNGITDDKQLRMFVVREKLDGRRSYFQRLQTTRRRTIFRSRFKTLLVHFYDVQQLFPFVSFGSKARTTPLCFSIYPRRVCAFTGRLPDDDDDDLPNEPCRAEIEFGRRHFTPCAVRERRARSRGTARLQGCRDDE